MRSARPVCLALLLVGTLAACAREEPAPEPTSPAATSETSPPESPSPAETESPEPSRESGPEAIGSVEVEQGGRYWAVYLAVGDRDSPELEQATAYLDDLGVQSFAGQLNCDRGAARALDLPDDTFAVAAYFSSRHDAQRFARSMPSPPAGIAKVRTYCAD